MIRWYLLLLPLCLLLQDRPKCCEESLGTDDAEAIPVMQKAAVLDGDNLLRQDLVASIAVPPSQPFPGSLPWLPLREGDTKGVDFLIHYHPLLFLEMCLDRYTQEVRGYSAKLIKRERVGGKLQPLEKVETFFREQPFSVFMNWLEGGVGFPPPQDVLYVKGENNDKLLARGRKLAYLAGVFEKDVHSEEVKKTGRYTIDEFGIYLGTERTVAAMRKAKERGTLHVTYQGLFKVPELADRECYKFVRTPYEPPEDEGVNELTIFIDKENWLQVGSILKDKDGNLIASYFFRDVKINPEFKNNQFTRAAL
jgi:hypothetical protein